MTISDNHPLHEPFSFPPVAMYHAADSPRLKKRRICLFLVHNTDHVVLRLGLCPAGNL